MGTAVCAGAALLPEAMNAMALLVYIVTKPRRDTDRHSGHRLFTHTAVFAVGLGMWTSFAASLPGTFEAGGKTYSTGTAVALLIMWSCLHLSLFGLFEKWAKEQRKNLGLVGVLAISGALTIVTASALPAEAAGGRFWWLGLAVGALRSAWQD